jgi:hypothetical protein
LDHSPLLLEICPEGVLRFVWGICQYTGAALVWLCTFGQDWPLDDERENLAGTAGLLANILLIWWLFRIF